MGDTESDGEAGRGLHPKVAKVVTGARQTGVKDRNFEGVCRRFWSQKRQSDGLAVWF